MTKLLRSLITVVCLACSFGASEAKEESAAARACGSTELEEHPVLCHMLDRLRNDLSGLAAEIHSFASQHRHLVGQELDWRSDYYPSTISSAQSRRLGQGGEETASIRATSAAAAQLPVVFAHGMGDSCFNHGMQKITQRAGDLLGGVYAVCIPTGKTQEEDTTNGYFLNMDASVDVFAEAVKADPKLKDGFHAIGFSQGSNIIRGYVGRYNSDPFPTVHSMISVNGPVAGVGAVPYCRPKSFSATLEAVASGIDVNFDMCDLLMEQASRSAYTSFSQKHSFQANYWRDPRASAFARYQEYAQLAVWNNEAGYVNETLRENYSRTSKFVWVMATDDHMVWPKEGEHWGVPDPNDPFQHILPMREAPWYTQDLFGLRTADEAGKNFFETFEGDHLQFSLDDFDRWVTTYFKD